MKYNEIITKVSLDNKIPVDLVHKVYLTYWYFIRQILQQLPLKDDMNEEEFSKLRPNINIPGLGKFHVLYPRYLNLKRKYLILRDKKII